MALGVLNNLSAIYAENNLNNTNASLQTVLQQLSSGSKINSGADDAAGLSLVNGLEANSTALMQSETNATEGVGLLGVADGALSQVTSLLNRAITLATEASNGTLDSAQDSAANQEYQSIMAEVNNIGSTTTYNQQQVFTGTNVAIYTGDSSTAGSSIDDLNIRTLSGSSVGDSGGVMSYSSGQNNVFLNLSSTTANAAVTDTLNATGVTSLDVNYLVKGSSGASTTATAEITVGTGTNYANTVNGLIGAINDSGLGLTASFANQSEAGVTGGGSQTGIQISGGLVSAGVDPSATSTSGTLNPAGIPASQLLTQGQTLTVSVGGTQVGTVTVSPTLNTLAEVVSAINGWTDSPVTAAVITNGDGSQSLSLSDASSSGGPLSVSTSAGTGIAAPVFAAGTVATSDPVLATASGAFTGVAATSPVEGSYTFGINGTNQASDILSAGGSITLDNTLAGGTVSVTFVVGAGTDTANTFYTGNHGDSSNSLSNLATTIDAAIGLGVTAGVGATGITVASTTAATGDDITASSNSLTNANSGLSLYSPTDGGVASAGTPEITALDPGSALATQDDVLNTGGHITLTNSSGSTTFTATVGQTYADLALQINSSNLGVTAQWSTADHALLLTSTGNGADPVVASVNTLSDTTHGGAVAVDNANAGYQSGTAGAPATYSTAVLQLTNGNSITDGSDDITGQIELQSGSGTAYTFVMGVGTNTGTTVYTGANTVASLVTAINDTPVLGITATAPGGVGTGGIYLQSTVAGTGHLITTPGATTLADAVAENTHSSIAGVTNVPGTDSTLTVGMATGTLNTSDVLATGGSISLTSNSTTHVFTIGTGTSTPSVTYLSAGTTLSQLAASITSSGLGVTAQANTTGLLITSTVPDGSAITMNSSTIADATLGTYSSDSLGVFSSVNDSVAGTLNFTVGGSAQTLTLTANSTVQSLITQINNASMGVTATWLATGNGFGNVVLTSNTEGVAGQIASPTAALVDTTSFANLSYTASSGYDTGLTSNATNVVYDSTSGQNSTSSAATFVSDAKSGSGAATTSYSDGAGESLNGTDLLNQTDSQAALNDLNLAISDVAAQDGYIGAQINTLNSISQVMSTQQENVVSAQNAIQATDYASATSNMSKYEILSQTGIAALAQANSVQQEVTKLLQ